MDTIVIAILASNSNDLELGLYIICIIWKHTSVLDELFQLEGWDMFIGSFIGYDDPVRDDKLWTLSNDVMTLFWFDVLYDFLAFSL